MMIGLGAVPLLDGPNLNAYAEGYELVSTPRSLLATP